MHRIVTLITLTFLLPLIACGDDGTGPDGGDEPFSLEVIVRDLDGDPVPDAQVVVWNMSSALEGALQDAFFRRRARTDVQFSLPRRAVCDFSVTNLAGEVVQSVLEADTLDAGTHRLVIGPELEYDAGVEIFRYELVTRDPDDGSETFRDAKWMTAVHLDPLRLSPSRTDDEGRWSTRDRSFVPGLLDLPAMPIVDENGDVQGSFALGDTLIVRVYDSTSGHRQRTVVVVDGPNTVEFGPGVPASTSASTGPSGDFVSAVHRIDTSVPPLEASLEQNRPNPFN